MQLSKEHEQILADMAGRLPNGKPKLRIVTPAEAVRPHGILKGKPKYIDPESGKQMPFLIVEQWYPPTMLGSEEEWDTEYLGPHPSKCSDDCCNNGIWGFRFPLTVNGEYIPFSQALMDAFQKRQFIDLEWARLTDSQRRNFLDTERANVDKQKAEAAWERQNEMRDHYLKHKETEDNADNRVWVGFGKNTLPDIKGLKEPIGSPKII